MPEIVAKLDSQMWPFAALLVGSCFLQVILFVRNVLSFNKKAKLLSQEEIKSAVKVGAVATLGPAVSCIVVAIATVAVMGTAVTYMRCAVIGADSYELVLVNMGAEALGVTAGGDDFSEIAFGVCLFAMTFGTMTYLINLLLTIKPLDKVVTRNILKSSESENGKEKAAKKTFLPLFGLSAAVGLFTYNSISSSFSGIPYFLSVLTGMAVTWFISKFFGNGKKINLSDWSLGIALILGMIVGTAASKF